MNYFDPVAFIDLDKSAGIYTYSADNFAAVEKHIEDAILNYDPDYGPYLLKHLGRTSRNIHDFMLSIGYSEREAGNVAQAAKLHDCGKILQDISNWRFTKEKKTDAQKLERPKHGDLGIKVLQDALDATGTILTSEDEIHADIIQYIMAYHHERINGIGPKGIAITSEILQIIGIVDGADGKMKAKCPGIDELSEEERHRVLHQVLHEMWTDPKHNGEFNRTLLQSYGQFQGIALSFDELTVAPPPLAFAPNS